MIHSPVRSGGMSAWAHWSGVMKPFGLTVHAHGCDDGRVICPPIKLMCCPSSATYHWGCIGELSKEVALLNTSQAHSLTLTLPGHIKERLCSFVPKNIKNIASNDYKAIVWSLLLLAGPPKTALLGLSFFLSTSFLSAPLFLRKCFCPVNDSHYSSFLTSPGCGCHLGFAQYDDFSVSISIIADSHDMKLE